MAFWRPGTAGPGQDRDLTAEGAPIVYNPLYRLPLDKQRRLLPVYEKRRLILYALEKYRAVILVGETGSGKTTQVPQYLHEAGWTEGGRSVVCTQPRRIAAMSVATRVATEMRVRLGEEVGYAVRFDDKSDPERTKVKFVTDGMLLRECLMDPLLSRYSVIMLDEAHERSLYTDVLLGVLKKIARKRPELRIIIASASLDAEQFKRYFERNKSSDQVKDTAAIVKIEGRQYPVDILYSRKPRDNYLLAAVETVLDIHLREPMGDVLVFMPGQEEVESVVRAIRDSYEESPEYGSLVALPMYASLPYEMQEKVFLPGPKMTRKVIVATNVAETSITIENIVYVVDPGFAKLPFYNPINNLETLLVRPISKASAKQRAGRAGRVRPGKCFRLYTEMSYEALPDSTVPEMQRTNVTWMVLQLKALGIDDILHFDFISPPSAEALIRALELLYSLGVIDDEARLVEPLGTQVAEFPVEPRVAKMLLNSLELKCSEEILSIAAMMSVQDMFINPRGSKELREKVNECVAEFASPEGDQLTALNVFNEFIDSGKDHSWCQEHCVSFRALSRAAEVRAQLRRYLLKYKGEAPLSSAGDDDVTIRRCLVSGFFSNAAQLQPSGIYSTIQGNREVQIHPSSTFLRLNRTLPPYIIYQDIQLTSQEYMRDLCRIDPRWLLELAGHYYDSKGTEHLSGSSGAIGLPGVTKRKLGPAVPPHLVREPASKQAKKEPPPLVNQVGKAKGGLRSQF